MGAVRMHVSHLDDLQYKALETQVGCNRQAGDV